MGMLLRGGRVLDPGAGMDGVMDVRIRDGLVAQVAPALPPDGDVVEDVSGRLVLPVGLGALDDQGFGAVGEETAARTRAELLDETLAILDGLWQGEPFRFQGTHHRVKGMTMVPRPVQRPRIPIWVVGAWPAERSMARAARWDGLVPQPLSSGPAPAVTTTRADRLPPLTARKSTFSCNTSSSRNAWSRDSKT